MSRSIKTILLGLSEEDKKVLDYAFENELINRWVQWRPGRFIGVNITSLPNLVIEQTEGPYSEGVLNIQGQLRLVTE